MAPTNDCLAAAARESIPCLHRRRGGSMRMNTESTWACARRGRGGWGHFDAGEESFAERDDWRLEAPGPVCLEWFGAPPELEKYETVQSVGCGRQTPLRAADAMKDCC